jgi:hypothetical protein
MYSITSRNTFDEAMQLHEFILRIKDTDHAPIVLVRTTLGHGFRLQQPLTLKV